jgi:hypothetical protein
LGVTPSAWGGFGKTMEFNNAGCYVGNSGATSMQVGANNYFNGSNYIYSTSNVATRYAQSSGQHLWFISTDPTPTAGNPISFTQAMTLDASGRLLVGRTTSDSNGYFLQLNGTTGYQAGVLITYAGVGSGAIFENSSGALVFGNDGASGTTERARVTAGGYFKANPSGTYIGSTAAYHEFSGDSASQYILRVFNDGNNANRYGMVIQCGADNAAGTNYALVFDDGDGTRQGEITFSGGTTTYGTSSDYRLKENIKPIENALDRLAQLKPVKWNWKRNGLESEGFVAHELQEVVPIAVAGEKDAVNENGDPVYQSVGAANVVPLLTKALQEAMTRIEQLEAKVAALESK